LIIFSKRVKKIREPEPEDNDSFESEEQENNVPANSIVPANSLHMPKRIYIQSIGSKKTITREIVVPENGVVLEVEGNQYPPSFVPYSMINSGEHSISEDVEGSQTPEHMPWGSESPKTRWSQQKMLRWKHLHLINILFKILLIFT
jgi:hypothetical protein